MVTVENRRNELGAVRIQNEVVGTIAGIAASEVSGVLGLGGGFSIAEVFGRKSFNKGIKVEIANGEAAIDLYITVEYGRNIPEISYLVQQNVKRAIENMTGLSVVEVNVNIEGVQPKKGGTPEPEVDFRHIR
ncbi:MAG: Asp23/Gls24 family envelope stress response protein [bacterium]|nr:Asp23/Gls24 family envelope stress response protein [bacterium]